MTPDEVSAAIERIYREESRRVFATLVRLLGDFDAAEEALHEAFAAAIAQWPEEGIPANPAAWLVSTGRFRAIDSMRRMARFERAPEVLAEAVAPEWNVEEIDQKVFQDDQLRLIFTCCHPALAHEAQVALTLREVCGLTTEEIARAFLTPAPTLAQRIVRAKAKIRDAKIPYEVPARSELAERLESVLRVVYLVFNEGYAATSGGSVTRQDLSQEAIRLGRLLVDLLPEAEVQGLLGLMLLHESRRSARSSPAGDLVRLEDQDRRLWNRDLIAEGIRCVERALASRPTGPYAIQAAIAAVHAEAASTDSTDWAQIVGLYDALLALDPSPIIELNRAVAVAMLRGPEAGLTIVRQILDRGDLTNYALAHAAAADFYRRLNRHKEARVAYEKALTLTRQEPERRFLQRRIEELT